MKRKVLKVGMSSLAISIPTAWAKEHKIAQGDEIDVSERDGGLFVATGPESQGESITIDAPEGEQFISRVITSPYIQGYNTIIVRYKEPATRKKVEQVLTRITGFEIVSEMRGEVTLKNVASGIEAEFVTLFRRMFHLLGVMAELLSEATAKKNLSLLDELDSYEHTLTKLYHFCCRILNTRPQMSLVRITSSYHVLCEIEGIGDLLAIISKHLRGLKRMPAVSAGTARTAKLLKSMADLYFSPTVPTLSAFTKETRALELWLGENAKETDAHVYVRLADVCHRAREIMVAVPYPFER